MYRPIYPNIVGVFPGAIIGQRKSHTEVQQHPGEPNGDTGKQNVEADIGREMDASKNEGVEFHCHLSVATH